MSDQQSWTIDLPPGTQFLTANHRKHWRTVSRVRNRYQGVCEPLIRVERIPALNRAAIRLTYYPPPRLTRDRHPFHSPRVEDHDNLSLLLKWTADAIVRAGVLPDDNARRCSTACQIAAQTHPRGLIRVTIQGLT